MAIAVGERQGLPPGCRAVAGFLAAFGDQPVHDDVDVVLELLVEGRRVLDGGRTRR